jgi:hypothetical protein
MRRNFWRVSAEAFSPTSASSTRSSAASSARARHPDRDLEQVARDRLDVAPDIAHLGELGRLDLQEGCLGEAREAPRDLGLAAARRPDHQDVLGQHLLAQLGRQLKAAPAVAQGDRDGPLGGVLADDEAVELGDDLARGEAGHLGIPDGRAPRHAAGLRM